MTDIRVLHTECVLCQTGRAAALPEGLTAVQSARVILGVAFDYGSIDALEPIWKALGIHVAFEGRSAHEVEDARFCELVDVAIAALRRTNGEQ